MPRIRSIKPEFWSSPSTAKASAVARLAFIAMWNWADDHGRGTANEKELEGFIFPNDNLSELSSRNTVHFRDLVAEVSECFDVVFYTVKNRPYYAILNWDTHQRNERRAKASKYPEPPAIPAKTTAVAEIPSLVAEIPHTSDTGTGEQGNRGTGEQGIPTTSGAVALRPTGGVTNVVLGEWIAAQDQRPPSAVIGQLGKHITQMVKDGINHQTIAAALDRWTEKGLHPNTLPSVVHELQTAPKRASKPSTTDQRLMDGAALVAQLRAEEEARA